MRVDGRIIGALVSFCFLCLGCRTCSENVVCSFFVVRCALGGRNKP